MTSKRLVSARALVPVFVLGTTLMPRIASAASPDIGGGLAALVGLAGIGTAAFFALSFAIAAFGGHCIACSEPRENRKGKRVRGASLCLGIGIASTLLWSLVGGTILGVLWAAGASNLTNWLILGTAWLIAVPLTHAGLVAALLKNMPRVGSAAN